MPKVILYEKAKKKIRDNRRHRYNAYDAYVHFLYQKKYKINSELSDLYMRYLGELKTWIEFKKALPKLQPELLYYTVVPNIVKESAIKKPKEKTKELFVFKTAEPYRKDYSRLVYWCNPFEPINKGKLGTTQGWRKEERFKQYY